VSTVESVCRVSCEATPTGLRCMVRTTKESRPLTHELASLGESWATCHIGFNGTCKSHTHHERSWVAGVLVGTGVDAYSSRHAIHRAQIRRVHSLAAR